MSFEKCFNELRRQVYPFFLRLAKDPVLAEDVFQYASMKCWQHWPHNDCKELTKLMRVVGKRFYLNYRDKERTERNRFPELALRWRVESTPDVAVQESEICEQVREGLRRLPPYWREVLDRAYYRGQDNDGIAKAMGKPLTTIKNWKRRALRHLRRILKSV